MLFILLLLFFPCAVVGAFVTADEHDLTVSAFQTAGEFFSFEPLAGANRGRSGATAKDDVTPRRRQGSPCQGNPRREDRVPAVSMLIGCSCSLQISTSKRIRRGVDETGLHASICSSDIVWPEDCGGGNHLLSGSTLSRSDGSAPRRRRRSRSSPSSDTALRAMAIPARCALPSVDLLREAYGRRRNFWGDLTLAETRRFYHELLPVSIRLAASDTVSIDSRGQPFEGPFEGEGDVVGLAAVVDAFAEEWECVFGAAETLEEKARLASMARHAAKLYVRERCQLPVRVVAHLYDGLRHLKNHGTFRVTGMTFEELWEKYEKQIRTENPTLEGEDLKTRVCLRILDKSCSTNRVLNSISGCSELNNDDDASSSGRDQPCHDSANRSFTKQGSREKVIVNAYGVDPTTAENRVATALSGSSLQPSNNLLNPLTAGKGDASNKKRRRRRERCVFGRPRLFGRGSRSRARV